MSTTAEPATWSTDTTPTITFSTTDALAGIDYYQVKIDSGSYATQTSPYTLPAQTDGTHTVTVKAFDRAGNSREASAITVYIDTTAPAGTTLTLGTATANSIAVSVSGSTDSSAGLHATPYYFQETTTPANTVWQAGTSWTHSTLSTNTQYTYQVKARDNTDTPNQSSFTTAQSKYTLADTPTNFTAAKPSNDNNKMNLTVDELPNAASGQSGYYFYRAGDEANHNSGWIRTNSWHDTSFTCNAHYTWSVKYRNGDAVETSTASISSNSFTNYPYSCGTAFVAPPATTTGQVTTTPSQPATTVKYLPQAESATGQSSQQTFTPLDSKHLTRFTKIEIPAGATTGATTVIAEPQTISQINQTTANASLPANRQIVSNLIINCQASSGGKTVNQFQKPITILFQYSEADIKQYQENTLKIY